jgi:large conductance mechanosensitive channel
VQGLGHRARTIDLDMLKGFRDFLMRGNVIDLAVAVVIGAAFGAVVAAFADDFIGGILGAIGGSPDFGDAGFTVNGSKIVYGSTLTALIQFAIVAAAIYFVIVVPMQAMAKRRGVEEESPAPSDEVVLLTDIRDLLQQQRGTGV